MSENKIPFLQALYLCFLEFFQEGAGGGGGGGILG